MTRSRRLIYCVAAYLLVTGATAWAGKPENVEAAQAALHKRARLNGLARSGSYSDEMEAA